MNRLLLAGLSVTTVLAAGVAHVSTQSLPMVPAKAFGTSITGAFEGWFTIPDGSHNFLVGYYNRNIKRAIDVPIGINNRIEPGGPDMGQPTHFLPSRHTGMFLVNVPKEFALPQKLTWTIVANGQTMMIPLRLNVDYNVSPFADIAVGNIPPVIKFEENGPTIMGPIAILSKALVRTTSVTKPLELPVWATDDAKYSTGSNAPMRNPPPPVIIHWSKYRGTGEVTFGEAEPKFQVTTGGQPNQPFAGKASTTATFSAPGEYVLHMLASDLSGDGGGGEVCCWTTVLVKVTVTP